METISMIKYGQFAWAIGNILLNVCFCFGVLFLTIRK
jgi:fluoride ion exporter CrcB/FEX